MPSLTLTNVPDSPLPHPDFAARFARKDPALWPGGTPDAVGAFLGWIDVIPKMRARLPELNALRDEMADFDEVVIAGMGGSSLAPYVLSQMGETKKPLRILDSTHPATVRAALDASTEKTLVIVASKSGSTAEPNAFANSFEERLGAANMIAITDPGSPFEKTATERGYRKVILAYKDIGGRYSALSPFGLVPAALVGLDVAAYLDAADRAVRENQTDDGPAFRLGAAMGRLAKDGVDKLTILAEPDLESVGLWLEQLIAESTGKHETGVFPLANEKIAAPRAYGNDRFFLVVRGGGDAEFDAMVTALKQAGRPVATLDGVVGPELAWLWMTTEIATATAGSVLGIDPFDQPDVEAAKVAARERLKAISSESGAPSKEPGFEDHGVTVIGHDCAETLPDALQATIGTSKPHEFVAIQAYLHETPETNAELETLQAAIRDVTGRATSCGYGPRFLHSTGQFHKGGTNAGYFIQLVDAPSEDLRVPAQPWTYGQFIRAQADGDRDALLSKGRRVLRLDLGSDVAHGLKVAIAAVNHLSPDPAEAHD